MPNIICSLLFLLLRFASVVVVASGHRTAPGAVAPTRKMGAKGPDAPILFGRDSGLGPAAPVKVCRRLLDDPELRRPPPTPLLRTTDDAFYTYPALAIPTAHQIMAGLPQHLNALIASSIDDPSELDRRAIEEWAKFAPASCDR